MILSFIFFSLHFYPFDMFAGEGYGG